MELPVPLVPEDPEPERLLPEPLRLLLPAIAALNSLRLRLPSPSRSAVENDPVRLVPTSDWLSLPSRFASIESKDAPEPALELLLPVP